MHQFLNRPERSRPVSDYSDCIRHLSPQSVGVLELEIPRMRIATSIDGKKNIVAK